MVHSMDAKDEVKRRLSVEEVVGDYIELKRAGRNFKAISPFTNERTPSFMVSPEKQIWHDFSSNKGGDIFSFIDDCRCAFFCYISDKAMTVNLLAPNSREQRSRFIADWNIPAVCNDKVYFFITARAIYITVYRFCDF